MVTQFKEAEAKSLLEYKKESEPFEKYLEDICFEENPQILDDDMSDFFDNWLGGLDGDDYLTYGNEFAVRLLKYVK